MGVRYINNRRPSFIDIQVDLNVHGFNYLQPVACLLRFGSYRPIVIRSAVKIGLVPADGRC